jgi:hypothetical protein
MVVAPLLEQTYGTELDSAGIQDEKLNWVGYAAGASLIAGGLLLLTGKRRAAMVAASAGTALALLDQKETVNSWWLALPIYLEEVQGTLNQVQNAVDDLAAKRQALHRILGR